MTQTTVTPVREKDKTVNFTLRERIELFRSSRLFLLLFPFVTLALMIVFFGAATSGSFFRPSVLRGVFSQAVIIGTCSIGVAFIYSNGNLDISIGSVLGLSATIGVMAYSKTGSPMILVLVTVGMALALMAFNCTMSVVFRIKTHRRGDCGDPDLQRADHRAHRRRRAAHNSFLGG